MRPKGEFQLSVALDANFGVPVCLRSLTLLLSDDWIIVHLTGSVDAHERNHFVRKIRQIGARQPCKNAGPLLA